MKIHHCQVYSKFPHLISGKLVYVEYMDLFREDRRLNTFGKNIAKLPEEDQKALIQYETTGDALWFEYLRQARIQVNKKFNVIRELVDYPDLVVEIE